jgi:hypothetical protein
MDRRSQGGANGRFARPAGPRGSHPAQSRRGGVRSFPIAYGYELKTTCDIPPFRSPGGLRTAGEQAEATRWGVPTAAVASPGSVRRARIAVTVLRAESKDLATVRERGVLEAFAKEAAIAQPHFTTCRELERSFIKRAGRLSIPGTVRGDFYAGVCLSHWLARTLDTPGIQVAPIHRFARDLLRQVRARSRAAFRRRRMGGGGALFATSSSSTRPSGQKRFQTAFSTGVDVTALLGRSPSLRPSAGSSDMSLPFDRRVTLNVDQLFDVNTLSRFGK